MYDSKKARIEEIRVRFEAEAASTSPHLRHIGEEYLEALDDFVETIHHGPGRDSRLLGLDTTGELARNEEQANWAEGERQRVRRLLAERLA